MDPQKYEYNRMQRGEGTGLRMDSIVLIMQMLSRDRHYLYKERRLLNVRHSSPRLTIETSRSEGRGRVCGWVVAERIK